MLEAMGLSTTSLWTVIIGMTAAVSCSLVGCYLVLRRMSLVGDAISHSILPGIALAVLISGQIGGWPAIVGAIILGLLTTMLIQWVHGVGGLAEDASIGVVFTSLFAVGVVLINRPEARRKHIDVDCVLYGLLETAPFDTVGIFGVEVPRALLTLMPVLLLVAGVITLAWKELRLASFDPALSTAMGYSATAIHYLLMAMVSLVVVASFEAVGSILVIAMLIVPAATAQLLTHRLGGMLAVASLVAASSTVFGYAGALAWNTSTAGMIAVAGGAQFLLAVIFAPGQGLVSRLISNAALGVRVSAEDLLARLYRAEEREGRGARLAWSARTWRDWLAEGRVARSGWAQREGSREWVLTDAGRAQAAGVIRAHRLWESYLDRNFDLPVDHLHDAAERMEHYIGPILQETLSESLPVTQSDPHGRRIPPPTELSR